MKTLVEKQLTDSRTQLTKNERSILSSADEFRTFAQEAYDTDYQKDKNENESIYLQPSKHVVRLGDEKERIAVRTEYPDCLIETIKSNDGKITINFAFEGSQGEPTGIVSALQYIYDTSEENHHKLDESINDWWITDYTVGKSENGIHRGFDEATQQFISSLASLPIPETNTGCKNMEELLVYAHEYPDDIEIQITGHSLGGALAQVFTYYLLTKYDVDKDQITTYTFASPVPFSDDAVSSNLFDGLYYSQNKNLTLAEICVIMEWVMKDEPIPDKPRGIRSNQDSGKREQGQENKQKTADVNAALRGV